MPAKDLFSEVIATHRGGDLDIDLTTKMRQVLDGIAATKEGKVKGDITLKLKFERNGDDRVLLTPTVKVNVPTPAVGDETNFVDDKGRLTDENPRPSRQQALFVEKPPAKLIDLGGGKPTATTTPTNPAGGAGATTTTDDKNKDGSGN